MFASDLDDSTPLIHSYGIPTPVRDIREPYQKRLAVYLILASIFFERIAFYTLAANLTLSLDSDKQPYWKSQNPSIATFIFIGISNISAIIFAVISDATLGRVKTILFGFVLYSIGYLLATLFTNPDIGICLTDGFNENNSQSKRTTSEEPCSILFKVALAIIATGAGAVQTNMAVFGAEQIQESKLASRFFDKYVIVVNIGAMIAMFVVPSIQREAKFYYIAYLIATLLVVLAAILFFIGRRYYIPVKLNDSVITQFIPVIINAFQTWYKYKRNKRSIDYELDSEPISNFSYRLNRRQSIKDEEEPRKFLDFAKAAHDGKFIDRIVDDVKAFVNAMIIFILLIPYWLISNQINSSFRQQAQAMDKTREDQLIIVSFIDPVTIILGILALNIFVYYKLDTRNWLSILIGKFVIGMFCGCITMLIAGGVEIRRQNLWDKTDPEKSTLNLFAQIPQDIGVGVSEAFIMVASFEFAYFSAPRSAQSLFMSLRFCSIGISSLIGAAYVTLFPDPICDLNFSCRTDRDYQRSFDIYFFILGGLQLIFIPIFYVCGKKFQIIKLNPQQIKTIQFFDSMGHR